MPDENTAQPQSTEGVVALQFTGQPGEYFRIWIVNVCLSVVTLGIYSAWAKVRRKNYFHGNTLLNGSAFEYLADPKAILKGRAIVFGYFVAYQLVDYLARIEAANKGTAFSWYPLLLGVLWLVLGLAFFIYLPRLAVRALAFNARNPSYRNIRFRFAARNMWAPTRRFPTLLYFMWPLTLRLLYPYYAYRKRAFILDNAAWGTAPFSFDAEPGEFYRVYIKSMLMFIVFVAGSIVTVGVGILPLYILFASYRDAAVARLTWRHTALGRLRFDCSWKTRDLFKLHFVNSLGIIFTMGLLVPWAAIRAARYQLQGISLQPADALDGFVAATAEQVAATGDEAVDFVGLDFSL